MRTALVSIFLVLAATAAAQDSLPQAEHSLRTELPCIRATFDDLFEIVEQSRSLIRTANANAESKYARESLTLEDGTRKIEFKSGFTRNMLDSAPPVIFDFYYSYSNSDAPISSLTMRFSDYSREVNVSGISTEQVNALHNVLVQDFAIYKTRVGGMGLRMFGAIVLGLLAYGLLVLGIGSSRRQVQILCLTASPILFMSIFFLPWNKWLAGTVIYADSASFIVRNSAVISLVGVVATITLGVAALVYTWYLDQRTRKGAIEVGQNNSELQGTDVEKNSTTAPKQARKQATKKAKS